MYSEISDSWLKHWDFIILDMVMLQIAYIFSCMMRRGIYNPYGETLYLNIGIIILLADICSAFFMEPYHGIMRRGYFMEFKNTLKHVFLVAVIEVLYLFLSQNGEQFSRLSFLYFIIAAVAFVYAERIIWKKYLVSHKRLFYEKVRLLLVTTRAEAEDILDRVRVNSFNEFEIIGIAYADSTAGENEKIRDIPVVCEVAGIPDYIKTRWIDSILFAVGQQNLIREDLVNTCINMGVTVHYRLEQMEEWNGNKYLNRMGGYVVLTSGLRIASARQVFMKRFMDIAGGVVGLIITGIITIFLAPAIFIASPGPVFFSQIRVGKNGKRFKIYKFRSMYIDAEERKKELMAKNEMQGFMFKMDADPRIIGSGPDGTRHGLGWFIRKTSLDEFPQFLNVLKGDMSLVGTRPPTVDEWNQYKYYHRARLATKPGLTGMWQISGRSDITDFEEVVKLDMQYIKNWNIGMDIKIILKTVLVVLKGCGSK